MYKSTMTDMYIQTNMMKIHAEMLLNDHETILESWKMI